MLIVPFEMPSDSSRGPVVLVFIIQPDNLERMKEADPFDVTMRNYSHVMNADRPIKDLDIVIAYEEDQEKIVAFRFKDDIAGLMNWLERGRKIDMRKGDLQPPSRLANKSNDGLQ